MSGTAKGRRFRPLYLTKIMGENHHLRNYWGKFAPAKNGCTGIGSVAVR